MLETSSIAPPDGMTGGQGARGADRASPGVPILLVVDHESGLSPFRPASGEGRSFEARAAASAPIPKFATARGNL
jgi:hypothetical protein